MIKKKYGKTFNVGLAAFLGLCLIAGSAGGADVAKIRIVDFQKILEESEVGKEAQRLLKVEKDKMEADLNAKGDEIKTLQERLERETLVARREVLEERERDIRIKVYDLKNLERRYRDELQEKQTRILNRIKRDVLEIVNELGRKEGYLLIIERAGVLYMPTSVDITDQLILLYNAEQAKKKD